MSQRLQGACFCGNVNFSIDSAVKWVAHCHCSMCRRLHGAAFVTWCGVADGAYQIDERDVLWYHSSDQAERGRCRHCASPLFFRSTRWPGELHVVVASLRDALPQQAQAHVYCQDAVSWYQCKDELPHFATVPSDVE